MARPLPLPCINDDEIRLPASHQPHLQSPPVPSLSPLPIYPSLRLQLSYLRCHRARPPNYRLWRAYVDDLRTNSGRLAVVDAHESAGGAAGGHDV